MKKRHKFLILLTMIAVFVLVYQPHFNYPMPLHVDEWHHLSEGLRMANYGEYFQMLQENTANKFTGIEMGFHFFLFLLSQILNLTSVYQFLPGLWTALSALVLFYVTYKKTNHNFWIAWLSMIFFASIRSNSNLTGLWFFTPLTFAIPFIYLYTYLITEGVEKNNKKQILLGLLIILILVPTHSISVLFAIPAFIVYLLFHYKYLIKECKLFLLFLTIPIVGVLFFKYTLDITWDKLIPRLWDSLQFDYGWGVLELQNSLTEVYSWIGYIMAIIGLIFIIINQKTKKYLFYIIWPITVSILIMIYKLTGISYLSPYQRNFYYFILAFPLLSAIGLYSTINLINQPIQRLIAGDQPTKFGQTFAILTIKLKIDQKYLTLIQHLTKSLVALIIFALIATLAFFNYYKLPPELSTYHVIEKRHYDALKFIADFPRATVMATPFVSTALYPIAKKDPVGTIAFYGNRRIVEEFFINNDCNSRQQTIKSFKIKYIISPIAMNCGWEQIYNQNQNYIYQINEKDVE